MMVGIERADAVFAAISRQAGFGDLTAAEKRIVQTQLRTVFVADLDYIVTRAQVNPSTLQNPAGQPTSSPTGPGATTAPANIVGLGTVS